MNTIKSHSHARWHAEKTAAYLSRTVADCEKISKNKNLFLAMANAAEEQAAIIAGDFERETGQGISAFKPYLRAQLIARMTKAFGPKAMRTILAAIKVRGLSVYSSKNPQTHPFPTSVNAIGARHKNASGGTLRAAVFGVNDGLVSNTSLVMGVAGAAIDANAIVLTGIAGLLAGAFSMAAGEYISMQSQREMFEYQIGQEREELERYPEEEAEELALIYNARGLPMDEARDVAKRLIADPEQALDILSREELGLNPEDLDSALGAAFSSFIAFGLGAIIPLIPFFMGYGSEAVPIAGVLATIMLFIIGAVLSLFSGRSAIMGGLRMAFIGILAGAATYAIGTLFNVSVG